MEYPNYTITIFFLGGAQTVVHCDDYTYSKNQWLVLNVPEEDDKTAFLHFNKDIIEKWLVQKFDPVAVAKQLEEMEASELAKVMKQEETPPPPEGPQNMLLPENGGSMRRVTEAPPEGNLDEPR